MADAIAELETVARAQPIACRNCHRRAIFLSILLVLSLPEIQIFIFLFFFEWHIFWNEREIPVDFCRNFDANKFCSPCESIEENEDKLSHRHFRTAQARGAHMRACKGAEKPQASTSTHKLSRWAGLFTFFGFFYYYSRMTIGHE